MDDTSKKSNFDKGIHSINDISKKDPELIGDKVFELHLHKLKEGQNGA